MKTPKTPTEKPIPKAKAQQEIPAVNAETQPKKPRTTAQKSPKKTQDAVATEPAAIANAEKPVEIIAEGTNANKADESPKAPKKAKAAAAKPEATATVISVPERVGLTAGSIWHFLDQNGATSVAKLVSELPEEEKIIQRSIGWLAQEGKITLDTIDKVETISLKS